MLRLGKQTVQRMVRSPLGRIQPSHSLAPDGHDKPLPDRPYGPAAQVVAAQVGAVDDGGSSAIRLRARVARGLSSGRGRAKIGPTRAEA